MSIKSEKIGKEFVREISSIILEEIKDEDLKFITITYAKVSTDLSHAKIYFTALDDSKKEIIIKDINRASSFIRRELASRVDIRKIPELEFIYDESIEYGNKIEKLIEELKED